MKIDSIFLSIDGEVNKWGQGTFSTFVRFSGCNLNCWYCDTKYAQDLNSGTDMSIEEVFTIIKRLGCKKVTITGGEPLLQSGSVLPLISYLFSYKYKVSIETNGTFPLPLRLPRIFRCLRNLYWIVDYKLDYQDKMNKYAFCNLTKDDFVKIVVENYKQLAEAELVRKSLIADGCKARFFLSPVHQKCSPKSLIEDAKNMKIFDFGINLQLHKLIGVD